MPDASGPLRAADAGTRQTPTRGYTDLPAVTLFCQEALDGALELVRADGGEVAVLDTEGVAMVTRARRKRPPRLHTYGAPSRPSQPINASGVYEPLDALDSQSTQLLPSARMARAYAPDQGLIGEVWKRRESMNVRLDEHTAGADATMFVEADARNHLAVPVYRPESLNHLGGRGAVIGVLRVFNRDQLWSYSANDKMLLELHADRLGRALASLEPAVVNVRRGDLVTALRELSSAGPTRRDLLARLCEITLHHVNAYSFTALRYSSKADTVQVELATRAGATPPGAQLRVADLPPWLQRAVRHEFVSESAPQGGAPTALACLGASQETPIRSALAAPLSANGQVIGVIVATSPQIDAFTDDAAIVFEALALATATFAENARLVENARLSVEQVNEQRRQLSALNNSVQTLNASLNVDETLQSLAEQASLLTTAQVCAVFLRAEGADELICRAVYPKENEPPMLLDATIPLEWRHIGERLMTETFLQEDGLAADSNDPESATAKMARVGAISFLATPIVRREEASEQERNLGALVIFTPGQPQRYAPEEIGLLHGLASQAAIAISNARLYNKLQEAYVQLQELDRLKDDFILTVSHEFRTPLTAI
ncbi:MAG: GAF domain-containing protein, partial [Ktedonobacterales bacterium]